MPETFLNDRKFEQLFKAILTLKNVAECKKFFRDLCTVAELEDMAERWEVVQLLMQDMPYREISKKTGASTATVTRVAHWLKRGEAGYQLVLKRQKKLK
jgi:TrpR-related protein YerC/YecD